MNLACSSTAKNLMIQACFSLSYAATVRYTRLSNVVSESLLKYQLTACAVSSLIQPMMQTEHGSFKQLMPFVLIGFSSCMAETSQRVKFISALILGIGYLIPSIKINLISSDKKNIEGQPLIPLESIVEAEKSSLNELSIESEEKVTQLLQNYGELAYPRGMIKLVLRDALRTSQQVDQGCILGELLAIQLQEYPIAEFKVDGAAIILCGIRELFFPSKVQDLLNQKEISSILNLGAMNGYYLPEDLSNPELLPPILNVFADDDPKSEWPLDQLAVLTDQLVQQAKKENKTVIIHCKEGKSRSVSVLIAYLILKGTFDSVDMCLDRIQQQRAIARPNSGFMEKLQSFAERVSEVRKNPIMTRPTHELIVEVNQLCRTQY